MRDNSGINETCPIIDNVIRFIDSLSDGDVPYQDKKDAIDYMEEIRSMNAKLREWGNEMYVERNEIDDEKDKLEDKCRRLESDLDDCIKENKAFEKQISELEDKVYDLQQ